MNTHEFEYLEELQRSRERWDSGEVSVFSFGGSSIWELAWRFRFPRITSSEYSPQRRHLQVEYGSYLERTSSCFIREPQRSQITRAPGTECVRGIHSELSNRAVPPSGRTRTYKSFCKKCSATEF
jgi:hypothetical protein